MGEGSVLYTFETSSFTMFIAEDERTLVNSLLGSSNTLLVDGASSGFSNVLKSSVQTFYQLCLQIT